MEMIVANFIVPLALMAVLIGIINALGTTVFLVARGRTVGGTPIALTSERSTYGAELTSAVGFSRINAFHGPRRRGLPGGDGQRLDFSFN